MTYSSFKPLISESYKLINDVVEVMDYYEHNKLPDKTVLETIQAVATSLSVSGTNTIAYVKKKMDEKKAEAAKKKAEEKNEGAKKEETKVEKKEETKVEEKKEKKVEQPKGDDMTQKDQPGQKPEENGGQQPDYESQLIGKFMSNPAGVNAAVEKYGTGQSGKKVIDYDAIRKSLFGGDTNVDDTKLTYLINVAKGVDNLVQKMADFKKADIGPYAAGNLILRGYPNNELSIGDIVQSKQVGLYEGYFVDPIKELV